MAKIADIEITSPRQCGRQTKRSNVPSATTDKYYKRGVFIPAIDHLISELEFRFSSVQLNGTQGMYLVSENLDMLCNIKRNQIANFFDWVLPSPGTLNQKVDLWKTK